MQSEGHRQILTRELEAVGLRLNKRPPQVRVILCTSDHSLFHAHYMMPLLMSKHWQPLYMLQILNIHV